MLKGFVCLAMLAVVAPFGLPFENTWFSGFVAGVTFCGVAVAAIVSMVEPTHKSSPFYIWLYRFLHSLFHLGTAYFGHPSVWKFFKGVNQEQETSDVDR